MTTTNSTTTMTPKQICESVMISGHENGSWDLDFNPEAKDDNGELRRGYFFVGTLAEYVESLVDAGTRDEDAYYALGEVCGQGAIEEHHLGAAIDYFIELAY